MEELYRPNVPLSEAKPPEDNLPRPENVRLGFLEKLTEGPKYLVELGDRQAFQARSGSGIRGDENLLIKRQALRTVVDTVWKFFLAGGATTGILWLLGRIISSY